MKILSSVAVAFGLGLAFLSGSISGASAAIVCNDEGECWHSRPETRFPGEARIVVHPDDWRWKEGERFAWREHEGRGYWRRGAWVGF